MFLKSKTDECEKVQEGVKKVLKVRENGLKVKKNWLRIKPQKVRCLLKDKNLQASTQTDICCLFSEKNHCLEELWEVLFLMAQGAKVGFKKLLCYSTEKFNLVPNFKLI